MVKFNLKQCAYFDAVAEHGGIAQAARTLSITQPAVAQGIDKLEQLTGLTLFERRHARGAELTLQRRAFRTSVRQLLATAARVEQDAAGVAAIESGALDVAILYDMGLAGRRGLRLARLASLKPWLLLPAGHALYGRRKVRLQELAREPFVLFEGAGSSAYFRGVLAGGSIDPPVAMRCYSAESMRSAVGNGLGISLTVMRPASGLSHDGQEVVSVPLADDIPALDIVLACATTTTPRPLISSFESFCHDLFARFV